jgi:hypothetical protein
MRLRLGASGAKKLCARGACPAWSCGPSTSPLGDAVIARLAAIASFLALQGCGFVYDQGIAGPYRLVAIDTYDQMDVCYTLSGGNCVGRVGSTVFAVGSNDAYVVAARHPRNDKARTEYFYIIRALDRAEADPSVAVRGPYDAASFQTEQSRLDLPPLTRIIAKLK